jgi:SpoVK/Ycf46/Vps4 family AAA+-type ATPase
MTIKRNCMTKADAVIIAAIETGVPSLVEARALVDQFHDMIRKEGRGQNSTSGSQTQRQVSSHPSLRESSRTEQQCALRLPNLGQTARLKHRLRNSNSSSDKMYGRAKIDLLEARLLGTA